MIDLPLTDELKKLRTRRDSTRAEYDRCLARREELAAEIRSVVREQSRQPDPGLDHRLSTLLAHQTILPSLIVEAAEAYAKATAAWAGARYRNLKAIGDEAADVINSREQKIGSILTPLSQLHHDDPRVDGLKAQLAAINEELAPHRERHHAAGRTISALEAEVHRLFPRVRRCQIHNQHIQQFVDRHRNYQPQEAA